MQSISIGQHEEFIDVLNSCILRDSRIQAYDVAGEQVLVNLNGEFS